MTRYFENLAIRNSTYFVCIVRIINISGNGNECPPQFYVT